jgi:hypothetical protein
MSSSRYFEESQCLHCDGEGTAILLYVRMVLFVRPAALPLVLLLA